MAAISNDWLEPLQGEFKKPYYKKLYDTVLHEYQTRKIFPAPDDIFNAFSFTPLANVKVVILGQDPYHKRRPGTWTEFFRKAGYRYPSVPGEYLSGTSR